MLQLDLHKALHAVFADYQYGVLSRDTLQSLLARSRKVEDLVGGRIVHALIVCTGMHSDSFLCDHLIRYFSACGSLLEANLVFSSVTKPTVYTWEAIMSACMSSGENQRGIELFYEMQQCGIQPDKVTFLCALQICGIRGSLQKGKRLHDQIQQSGLITDLAIGSTLVDMYARCGDQEEALRVFLDLRVRDVVSWNALIGGYLYHGDGTSALRIFERMKQDSVNPDRITFLYLLKAYAITKNIDDGYLTHHNIVMMGLDADTSICTALIDMYAKFENLDEAYRVLDKSKGRNVVSWNAMIAGYAQHGNVLMAYNMFDKMKREGTTPDASSWNVLIAVSTYQGDGLLALDILGRMQKEGIRPNKISFLCALKACVNLAALVDGNIVHDLIIRNGLQCDVAIGNSLVDMYAKCGCLIEARAVFNALPQQDIVSWNSMLVGYTQHEQEHSALGLFGKMQSEGIEPDYFSLSCILKACQNVGALKQGMLIHWKAYERYLELDVVLGSSLVDMYAGCGSMKDAENVFRGLKSHDLVSWNSMIAGYAQHGFAKSAVQCIDDMKKEGMLPTDRTYLSILAACSHSGNLMKGWKLFESITDDLAMNKRIEHFNSMVNLLGHSGNLNEAKELINTMPHSPSMTSWLSLLHSCRLFHDKKLAQECFHQAFHFNNWGCANSKHAGHI